MTRTLICGGVVALTSSLMALTVDQAPAQAAATPPAGFTALYNGRDLTGWRGGDTFDHRKLMAMNEAERTAKVAAWNATMRAHWSAQGPELVNDGQGAYATTEKDYGDVELRLEYRTVPKADSGIYLRGTPQVQIWDYTEEAKFTLGANKGSGGLWNNSAGTPGKDPLVLADKPFGQWNTVRIVMVGSRVSVWLNSALVVDHAIMENYYDRATPVPARGPIQLQTHGGEIRWRHIVVREIPSTEANDLLRAKGSQSFKDIFNGRDFSGWAGALDSYDVRDNAIVSKPEKGGTIYWNQTLTDFEARVEFKLPAGGNNGLAIRYPGTGDTAYVGMTELQVLDDNYEKVRGPIDPRQAHGSAYGMVAAARGYQRPIGEWNVQDVQVIGSTLRVELNGTVILTTDLSKVDPSTYMAGSAHPGVTRKDGFFGFAGHNDPVTFRRVQVRPIAPPAPSVQRDPQQYRLTLENPDRVAALQVDKVIATLGITPGMRVADLGAGSGVFTIPLARAVGPTGAVYAIDIDAGLLAIVADKVKAAGLANVRTVVAGETDPRLPEPVDLLFICDTMHHLPNPAEYVKPFGSWLRTNGRVAVIDFAPGQWPAGHDSFTITPAQVDAWMTGAGFTRLASHDFLASNFFHVYRR